MNPFASGWAPIVGPSYSLDPSTAGDAQLIGAGGFRPAFRSAGAHALTAHVGPAAQPQQIDPAVLRAALFSSGIPRSILLPSVAFTPGDTVRFDLPKAGIGLHMLVTIHGTVQRGATLGAPALSPLGPYNLVRNVLFSDFSGIARVNASAFLLRQRQDAQLWSRYPRAMFDALNISQVPSELSQAYSHLNSSLATTFDSYSLPAASGSANIGFQFEVPIALHRTTSIGALQATVPNGTASLYLYTQQLAGSTLEYPYVDSTAGDLSLFTGASFTASAEYFYIDPPAGLPLPLADLAVIHELAEVTDTTGLAAGTTKTFTLDTGRTYQALYALLVGNGAPDTVDVSRLTFLVNQSTPTYDVDLLSHLAMTRDAYGKDLQPGLFFLNFAQRPWTPDQYGSLALALQLGSSYSPTAPAYLRVLKETTYISAGSPA